MGGNGVRLSRTLEYGGSRSGPLVCTSRTLVETERCTCCLDETCDACIRFVSDSRLAYLSGDRMPISGRTANVKDADFFAGFLLLPPCAILEILSRKLWLLLLLRLLLRSRIVVFLMCSSPSFRLCSIGFASGFALISFRCNSFN